MDLRIVVFWMYLLIATWFLPLGLKDFLNGCCAVDCLLWACKVECNVCEREFKAAGKLVLSGLAGVGTKFNPFCNKDSSSAERV